MIGFYIRIFLCVPFVLSEARQLIQGNLMWRHGDRSSRHTYPNDPYKDVWKDGKMQLTEQGMSQEYDLGIFLRSKYGHLLSEKYREGEIFIRSTDTDRSLMSAQCVTAGLYADRNTTMWKGVHSSWRPFPIHTASSSGDWLRAVCQYPEKGCPAFSKLLNTTLENSKFYQELEEKYATFYKNLTKLTGATCPYGIETIGPIYDNLFCLRANGHKLPDWVDNKTMATLVFLAGIRQGFHYNDYEMKYAKKLSKMKNGIILQKMAENMKNRIDKKTNYSIVGYSGHDTSVGALLSSMGAFNWIVPPYASCVILDLLQEDDGSYHVEFYFRNESKHELYPLTFYECGTGCSWEKFQLVAASVITDSETPDLCGIRDKIDYSCRYLAFGITAFILTCVLCLMLCWCLRKRQRDRKALYRRLSAINSEEGL